MGIHFIVWLPGYGEVECCTDSKALGIQDITQLSINEIQGMIEEDVYNHMKIKILESKGDLS